VVLNNLYSAKKMNLKKSLIKKTLLFDINSSGLNEKKLQKLEELNISTVFFIIKENYKTGFIHDLFAEYKANDFNVFTISVDKLNPGNYDPIYSYVENIRNFYSKNGCLIVSNDYRMANTIISCYYVLTGIDCKNAIQKTYSLKGNFNKEIDSSFVKLFHDNLRYGTGHVNSEKFTSVHSNEIPEDQHHLAQKLLYEDKMNNQKNETIKEKKKGPSVKLLIFSALFIVIIAAIISIYFHLFR